MITATTRDLRSIAVDLVARRPTDLPSAGWGSIGAAIEELRDVLDRPQALRQLAEDLILRWDGPPSLVLEPALPGSVGSLLEELRARLELEREAA